MELEVLRYTNRISSEAHREVSWAPAWVGQDSDDLANCCDRTPDKERLQEGGLYSVSEFCLSLSWWCAGSPWGWVTPS